MPTRTHWHRRETARGLTRGALRGPGAGTLAAVGRALPEPKTTGTVGSYVTRRVCPDLVGLFEVLTGARPWSTRIVAEGLRIFAALNRLPETRAWAMAEMVVRAAVYAEVVDADPRTLEARVRYLLHARHRWNADESDAAESGSPDFPDKLDREAFGQIEAAEGLRILAEVHGIHVLVQPERKRARRRA